MNLFDTTSFKISQVVTQQYSTSFFHATQMLDSESRMAIHALYGFVRFADEIVDTLHNTNQKLLLETFEYDLQQALDQGISLNPILHSFALVVQQYNIPYSLIQSFLESMKMDLYKQQYTTECELNDYIYGSADVVGLMCLLIFVKGDEQAYEDLKFPAQKLGSAFQKVNFLRDLKADVEILGRSYFYEFSYDRFDEKMKHKILSDIERDFLEAKKGINTLPGRSKLAVSIAYAYYTALVKKIHKTPSSVLLHKRIRISNVHKIVLFIRTYVVSLF
ncbi:MAG: phytoene/squalene synthase family protein [Bacteroidales bacterium]